MEKHNKILIPILAIIIFLSFNTFSYALAIDNNCPLNVIHILQVTPALLCLEERIDTLENAVPVGGGSGEANTASNLGSVGEGWYAQKVAVDLQFKKIVNGTGIIINSNGTRIMINSTITGSGSFQPHTLLNATAHTDTVTQSPTRGSIVYGNSTPKWSELVIGNAGRYLKSDGTDIAWNYLTAQTYTGTQALSLSDEIVICATGGANGIMQLPDGDGTQNGKTYVIIKRDTANICTLNTVGSDVFYGGTTAFVMRNQWETVTVTQFGTNTWYFDTMSVDAKNIGSTGEGIYTSKTDAELQFKKLLGTSPIELSSNSTNISIACSTCLRVGQQVGDVYFSLVKTNIGNTYIDIYTTAFDEEDMMVVDCTNVVDVRAVFLWDYVGTGTQQVRWVDVSNNLNVFIESATFTADQDPNTGSWITKPAWCTGVVTLEWQGKSTTTGDDPVAKGYKLFTR